MRHHAVEILLIVAAVVTLLSSIGLLAMRDPLQRLHFVAPPAGVSAPLLALAVFLDEPQLVAGFKAVIVAALLIAINAVVTHATARAVRVHARGHWEPDPDEHVPIVHNDRPDEPDAASATETSPSGEAVRG